MTVRDPRRSLPARAVEDIDAPDVLPGDVEVRCIDGVVEGYGYACVGCGSRSWLAIGADNPHPRWSVTAGAATKPETVTLSPSILHAAERGGCGWHGYLTAGVFTPC